MFLVRLFTGRNLQRNYLQSRMPTEDVPKQTKGDHTESIQVEYDPNQTTYGDLLDIFWKNHNPFVKNKPQYMSAIFYHDNEQKQLAEETMKQVQQSSSRKVQTVIKEAGTFYDAEDYHQKYLLRRYTKLFQSLNLSPSGLLSSTVAARLNGYLNGHGTVTNLKNEMEGWKLNEQQVKAILVIAQQQNINGGSCRM